MGRRGKMRYYSGADYDRGDDRYHELVDEGRLPLRYGGHHLGSLDKVPGQSQVPPQKERGTDVEKEPRYRPPAKGHWTGVDFDGTLSQDHQFGPPVPAMVRRIERWIAAGMEVRLVTARAVDEEDVARIRRWLYRYGLPQLPITDRKDFGMIELWDDRAVTVERGTGKVLTA